MKTAMILCAGLGIRMRPLTNTLPKPLIKVAGKTMLDRAFEHLKVIDISHIVVNAHYLSPQIVDQVKERGIVSHEDDLLETGGGVHHALPLLGNKPFFVLNGDCIWTGSESLKYMEQVWDEDKMEALLLVIPREKAHGYNGAGDFFMSPDGHLSRRGEAPEAPYVFIGIQILNPDLFRGETEGPYSLNVIYNKALEKGRLYGVVHHGEWFHIGTPEDLRKYDPMVAEIEKS